MKINQDKLDRHNKHVYLGKTLVGALSGDPESKPASIKNDNSVNTPKYGYGKDKLPQIGDRVRLDLSKQ